MILHTQPARVQFLHTRTTPRCLASPVQRFFGHRKHSRDGRGNSNEELYTDMAFIHNLPPPIELPGDNKLVDSVVIGFEKFDAKWRLKYNETRIADYVKSECKDKKWQRAYGAPGEPSDNNTLESLNRTSTA